jgi:hypothetical protein
MTNWTYYKDYTITCKCHNWRFIILGCHTVSFGEQFRTFQDVTVFSSSESSSPKNPLFFDCLTLKMKVLQSFQTSLLLTWHNATSQKAWIFSITTMQTLNLMKVTPTWYLRLPQWWRFILWLFGFWLHIVSHQTNSVKLYSVTTVAALTTRKASKLIYFLINHKQLKWSVPFNLANLCDYYAFAIYYIFL